MVYTQLRNVSSVCEECYVSSAVCTVEVLCEFVWGPVILFVTQSSLSDCLPVLGSRLLVWLKHFWIVFIVRVGALVSCYKQADNACCGAESFVIAYRITAAGKLTANWADWSNTILLVTTALRVFLYFVCRNVLFLLNIVSLKRKQKLVSVLAN